MGLLLLPHSHLLQSSFINFYLIFPSSIPIYCSLPKNPFHISPSSEFRSSPHSKSHIVFHLPIFYLYPLQISFFFFSYPQPRFIAQQPFSLSPKSAAHSCLTWTDLFFLICVCRDWIKYRQTQTHFMANTRQSWLNRFFSLAWIQYCLKCLWVFVCGQRNDIVEPRLDQREMRDCVTRAKRKRERRKFQMLRVENLICIESSDRDNSSMRAPDVGYFFSIELWKLS